MAELDNLQIKISAESQNASASLDRLITRLNTLSTQIGKVSGGGLTRLADGVSKLGQASKNIGDMSNASTQIGGLATAIGKLGYANVGKATANLNTLQSSMSNFVSNMNSVSSVTFDVSSLANLTNSLSRLGSKSVTQATANLPTMSAQLQNLVRQMNNIGSLSFDTTNLTNLVSAISKLGGKSVTNAITNIPILATELKGLMQTLSTAPQVSNNLIQMTNALANFASQGARVGSTSRSLISGLNGYSTSAQMASKSTFSLASAFGKFYASYWLLVRGFGKIKEAIDISSELTEVQNVVDVTFGNMAYKVEELAETSIEDFGMSELALKQYSSRFQAMGSAMGINNDAIRKSNDYLSKMTDGYVEAGGSMADMSLNLTKLTADMSSFYNVSQEDVAKDLESIFTGQTRPLRTYGLDLTQATLSEWAMKQGLDANVQSMSQAEKTLLRYQYVLANTTNAQGDFARTSDSWANSTRILNEQLKQLGSIIGGNLVQALKPAVQGLNILISKFMQLAQTISDSLGTIFGWEFEIFDRGTVSEIEGAASGADDLASGIGSAADNAKKLNSQLAKFDEINNITINDSTSSGGGAGAGFDAGAITAPESTGGWKEIKKNYESELDTLYKLGNHIGETLTNALANIKWDEIYEKARKFGTGLADFLNGLISPELFGEVGKTIASALNTAIYSALSFGEEFDFENFGSSIAEGINDFFTTFDFAALADTLNVWVQGIWETITTAIDEIKWEEVWDGVKEFFTNLDIETVAIIGSLTIIPKLLKSITAKKFVTGTVNLWKGFKTWGERAELLVGTLRGNEAAASGLAMLYPELGDKVSKITTSFSNFAKSVGEKGILKTLNDGITNFRNNLGILQKGLIGIASVGIEFAVLKDAFYDITMGSDNLIGSIGKIAGVGAAASAALYAAFGPAGLAVAGVTAVISAISGINKAFDDIRAEEIGESIKNAMSNPGGTPLSEIVSSFTSALEEAGSGFSIISEKSNELDSVQGNIKNTWTEIYKIQEAMENGVMSVEEGKEKLNTLFSELATLTEQKFSAMNTVIISAYGDGGSLRNALNSIGADTEAAIDTMITYGYQNSERAKQISEELVNVEVGSERYKELSAELASLTGEMSGFDKAVSDFAYDMQSLQGKIDYSEIFLEDGTVDTQALQKYLDKATTALSEYETTLDDSGKEIQRYWQEIYNSSTATEEQQSIAKAQLDYIPQAIESMKGDAEIQVVAFTDMIQNEFIGGTSQIIDDAVVEWNKKGWGGQILNGIFGAGTEGEYVKEAVDKQKENIDTVSAQIEESLGQLGIDGAAWGSEAAEQIYDGLFDTQYIHSEMGSGHWKYELNENYKELINGATEGISELASERGKDAVDGYANGISNNVSTAEESANTFTQKVLDMIAKTQDSHSPSKVTQSLAKDAVDGYNVGIQSNTKTSISAVGNYMNTVLKRISEAENQFRLLGSNSMQGFINGMSSVESELYRKADSIANKIKTTIQRALDIHSPSRVMYGLGKFTMQGFQNGIESLYSPIINSVSDFGNRFSIASTPKIDDIYGNSQIAYSIASQYVKTTPRQENNRIDNEETNYLLRELIGAVREGKVIEMNGREVGRQIQREDMKFYKQNKRGMFEH